MEAHADVEVILANGVDHVLVGSDTGRLERLRGDLFLLQGEKVHARGERVHGELLLADIEDLDLSLRYTTAVARLDIRLVLDVTGALPRTCSHRLCQLVFDGACQSQVHGTKAGKRAVSGKTWCDSLQKTNDMHPGSQKTRSTAAHTPETTS